jgi:hypothetical protein
MHRIIPEGKHGSAEVVHWSPNQEERLAGALRGRPLRSGTYTRLEVDGAVCRTDTDFEWRTNVRTFLKMRGDVLMGGLGIGFLLVPLLNRNDVLSVTVLEYNADVIALVAPYVVSPKLHIIKADAFEWSPPANSYDHCHFDLWPELPDADDWIAIKKLRKRYLPSLREGGTITAWCEAEARKASRAKRMDRYIDEQLEYLYSKQRFHDLPSGQAQSLPPC